MGIFLQLALKANTILLYHVRGREKVRYELQRSLTERGETAVLQWFGYIERTEVREISKKDIYIYNIGCGNITS